MLEFLRMKFKEKLDSENKRSYLAEQFWTRFRHEYLQSFQPRGKWVMDRGNLEINDVVLLKDDVQPRNLWQLVRVIKTYTLMKELSEV